MRREIPSSPHLVVSPGTAVLPRTANATARAGTGTGMNGVGGHGGEDRPDETETGVRREYAVRMSALEGTSTDGFTV